MDGWIMDGWMDVHSRISDIGHPDLTASTPLSPCCFHVFQPHGDTFSKSLQTLSDLNGQTP